MMVAANENGPRPRPILARLGLARSRDLAEVVSLLRVFVEQGTNAARMSYGRIDPATDAEWWESDPNGYELVRSAEALIAKVTP